MPRPWIVTRHDPIEKIDDNLWGVNGDVPGFPPQARFHRRMHIVKLGDGRLVFHNGVPIGDAALADVMAWGKPSILIVPSPLHAIDVYAFQAKLGLAVFTSQKAVEAVRKIVKVDGTVEELPDDPALRCEPLGGTKFGEAVYVVRSGRQASLLFCDAIVNSRPGSGFKGFVIRSMGFTGREPKIFAVYKLRAVSDLAALKRDLLRLADTPDLVRLVPSHGEIVTQDPAGAIRRAVARA